MSITTALTTFAAIFVAELPDKTMVASMVMSARFRRPAAVWVGAASAFTVQVSLAVVAGGVLSLLPEVVVRLVTACLFAAGAFVLWREGGDVEGPGDVGTAQTSGVLGSRQVAIRAFAVVFVAEFGDLTQLATASLTASTGEPLSVLAGALLALWAVAGVAVVAGRALLRVVPVLWVRRGAAGIFATLALWSLAEGIRSL